jgi:hypothetical protein
LGWLNGIRIYSTVSGASICYYIHKL